MSFFSLRPVILASATMAFLSFGGQAQTLDEAQAAFNGGNFETALEVARLRSNAGEAGAQTLLGQIYEDGLGVDQDVPRAIGYYQAAIAQDDTAAMIRLADIYLDGRGSVPADPPAAYPLLQRAEELGDVGAFANLGVAYFYGYGVEADGQRALDYFRRSHAAGDLEGTANLAWMYDHGEVIEEDLVEARRLFALTYPDGPIRGLEAYGTFLENGVGGPVDMALALEVLQHAADRGSAAAASEIGVIYDEARGGIPQDSAQALAHFRRAVELDDTTGYYNLGYMYLFGRGVDQNDAEALRLMSIAARRGDGAAA